MNLIQVTIISATVGKIPWKKWSSPHNQQKSLTSKNNRKIPVYFQSEPCNITATQVYAPTTDAQEAEVEQFYDDLLELMPKKDVLFIIGD